MQSIADETQRVANSCIFGYFFTCKINLVGSWKESYIFNKGSRSDSVEYLRLFFFIQVDRFCITAALKIKYGVICPAMLIIPNQFPGWISAQRGFAGST